MMKNREWIAYLLLGLLSMGVGTDQVGFKSSEKQVHLVELFSTQSCSSCPVAQKWISKLRKDPDLWKTFVPIVLHVDYWDHLGWKDPYSKKEFTRRQHQYAQSWKSRSVYTPMSVLDGKEWRPGGSWSTRSSGPFKKLGVHVGVLEASPLSSSGLYEVTFSASSKLPREVRVFGAILGNEIHTKVKSGENSGKNLGQDFLVLDLTESVLKLEKGKYKGRVQLDMSRVKNLASRSAVFWVTRKDNLELIQAVGGDLKKKGKI